MGDPLEIKSRVLKHILKKEFQVATGCHIFHNKRWKLSFVKTTKRKLQGSKGIECYIVACKEHVIAFVEQIKFCLFHYRTRAKILYGDPEVLVVFNSNCIKQILVSDDIIIETVFKNWAGEREIKLSAIRNEISHLTLHIFAYQWFILEIPKIIRLNLEVNISRRKKIF